MFLDKSLLSLSTLHLNIVFEILKAEPPKPWECFGGSESELLFKDGAPSVISSAG